MSKWRCLWRTTLFALSINTDVALLCPVKDVNDKKSRGDVYQDWYENSNRTNIHETSVRRQSYQRTTFQGRKEYKLILSKFFLRFPFRRTNTIRMWQPQLFTILGNFDPVNHNLTEGHKSTFCDILDFFSAVDETPAAIEENVNCTNVGQPT